MEIIICKFTAIYTKVQKTKYILTETKNNGSGTMSP